MRKPTCEAKLFAKRPLAALVVAALIATAGAAAQELQFADLGECALERGEVIRGCVVGYRTVGELNADSSNAVLFPASGMGTSEGVLHYVGADRFVDPATHFVIAVDPFGNGVSSSPSNGLEHPGEAFPQFSIRDIVRAQHRLVTEHLGLSELQGVIGISFGGLQVYEWATTYPSFIRKAVPIVATPEQSPADLLAGRLLQSALGGCAQDRCEEASELFLVALRTLLQTPRGRNRQFDHDAMGEWLDAIPEAAKRLPPATDMLSQLRAPRDLTGPFNGSLERTAQAVEADLLIVTATHDLILTPESSREFARLTGARLYESESDCGHQVFLCEGEEIGRFIRDFLSEP